MEFSGAEFSIHRLWAKLKAEIIYISKKERRNNMYSTENRLAMSMYRTFMCHVENEMRQLSKKLHVHPLLVYNNNSYKGNKHDSKRTT